MVKEKSKKRSATESDPESGSVEKVNVKTTEDRQ
jgi:hypothetical protein